MPLVVIVPAALLPAGIRPDPYSGLLLPGLARLAAGTVVSVIPGGIPEAWCRLLGARRFGDWPLAPLAARGDGFRAQGGSDLRHWCFATPVQTVVGHTGITVASARLAVPPGQADRLLSDLGSFFAADALAFARGPSSGEWYVCRSGTVHLDTRPPGLFPGEPLDDFLPGGSDAPTWRRWLSEMQMLLHDHPLNAEREAQGQPRIDTLWIWGGGQEITGTAGVGASGLRGYLDDPRYVAVLRGGGGTVAGTEAAGRALPASGSTQDAGGAESETVVHLEVLARAFTDGGLDAWRSAVEALDREVLAPLARRASRDAKVRLVLGGHRHAVALESRSAGPLARLAVHWRRSPELRSLIERWREPAPEMGVEHCARDGRRAVGESRRDAP